MDSGEERLKALGYKQELKRGKPLHCRHPVPCHCVGLQTPKSANSTTILGEKHCCRCTSISEEREPCAVDFTLISNAAISFSIVSSLTCITGGDSLLLLHCHAFIPYSTRMPHPGTTGRGFWSAQTACQEPLLITTSCSGTAGLPISYGNGGAPTAVWGWVLVASMTMLVGLAMAEIVSSLPTSGGPYFWCACIVSPHARMAGVCMHSPSASGCCICRATHLAPRRGTLPAFAGWMTGCVSMLAALGSLDTRVASVLLGT